MKDLNDLMQAILDMDAAQRKATEAAKAERAEQLGRLDAQRRAIADDFAAKAQARSQAAAAAAAHIRMITAFFFMSFLRFFTH